MYRYSNADTDDLWHALEPFSGFDSITTPSELKLKTVMNSWTSQRSFPLVQVDVHAHHVVLSQVSYLKAKQEDREKRDKVDPLENIWYIPIGISFDSVGHHLPLVWLTEKTTTIPVDGNLRWIKVNRNVTGYYITNYNDAGWAAIIKQLKEDHTVFEPVDRSGLIHDAFKLTCDGIISPLVTLELLSYLDKENDYLPWSMLRSKYLCFAKFLGDKQAIRAYKSYIWSKQKHLKKISIFGEKAQEMFIEKIQQFELYLFAIKSNFLSREEIRQFKKLFRMLSDRNLTGYSSPEIRTLALLFGFKRNNQQEFDNLWRLYMISNSDYDRKILLKDLSTFNLPVFTQTNLQYSLNEKIVKKQDGLSFLCQVIKQANPFSDAWVFLEANWKILTDRYDGGSELTQFLVNIVSYLETEENLKTVSKFIKTKNWSTDLFGIKRINEKMDEKLKNKSFKWLKTHQCSAEKWLHKQNLLELRAEHKLECDVL
ncbi:Endoplasmic reticulum aminopeptidase 1 [Thelohanellus kitauei]|uniref:Endoplasmic reticulum aminopeptidase 1 n=1 Tax=Thelohanellus kitauei TaxID=669202 RepID=A0A0C2J057_THEKT|nr:Endoplasmic reticulum aminopeptidase 1 [Thelohanellus kitauei]